MKSPSADRRAARRGGSGQPVGSGFERLEPRLVLAAEAAGLDTAWFAAVTTESAAEPSSIRQQWLVQLTAEAAAAFGSPAAAGRAFEVAVPGVRILRGLGGAGQLLVTAETAAGFVGLPEVAFVERNGLVSAAAREPDDPRYQDGSLWALANRGLSGGLAGADIDAPTAWELTTGSADVVIAVIDGGIDISHPDLVANVWRNPGEIPGNGIDDDANGFVDDVTGWDFHNRNGSVFDAGDNDHGTQVAGIIAATGDNGLGVVGVSWNTRIMPLKFIGSGGGSTADAISALNYAILMRQRGVNVRVANLSWGSGDSSPLLRQAIENAGAAGILVVASAGNSGLNQDTAWSPNYPSSFPSANILAVAATDSRDLLAADSNYGRVTVDLAAPGVGILSTAPGRRYAANSGTSFAAPFVSGVAALAASIDPSLSVSELRQVILAGVEAVPSLSGKVASGGRLNAARTLAVVIDNDPGYAGREFLAAAAGETLIDSRARVGPRELVIRGPGQVVIEGSNQHTGGTRIEAGTLTLRSPLGLGVGTVELAGDAALALDIGFETATVGGFGLSSSAGVDLGLGGIVVTGGGDEATVREWIIAGRTSSNGVGIRSSAATDASRTIGYAVTTAGEASVVLTAPGDLDLDRDVDVLDLIAFQAAGRFGTGAPAGWREGDVDYDGRADVFDLVAIGAGGRYGRGSIMQSVANRSFSEQPPATASSLARGAGGEGDLDLAGRGRSAGGGGLSGVGIEFGRVDAGAGLEIGGQREGFAAGLFELQLGDAPLAPRLLALDDGDGGSLGAGHVELQLGDAVGLVGRAADASPATHRLTDRRGHPRIRFEFLHRLDHERMLGQAAAAGTQGSAKDDERES